MRARLSLFAVVILPTVVASQQPTQASSAVVSASPVADAFRMELQRQSKNLIAAAEIMPADKYGYKPTPAQMSFGDVVAHLSGGNDALCGVIAGAATPTRTKLTGTDTKDSLVARLKETFQFCTDVTSKLDDSNLGEKLSVFGMSPTRAMTILITADDWGDHYSQSAIYLRLNGLLPPTAKPAPTPATK
jgi:hypothetical protein